MNIYISTMHSDTRVTKQLDMHDGMMAYNYQSNVASSFYLKVAGKADYKG